MVLAAVGAREYGGLSFRGRTAGDEWRVVRRRERFPGEVKDAE